MAGALEHFHQLAKRDVALYRDDVGTRDHDIHGAPLAQRQDVLEHGAFARREAVVAGAAFQRTAQIGAERLGLAAEQVAEHPGEEAFLFYRCRGRDGDGQVARPAR